MALPSSCRFPVHLLPPLSQEARDTGKFVAHLSILKLKCGDDREARNSMALQMLEFWMTDPERYSKMTTSEPPFCTVPLDEQ